ncbi:MAG: hypothetical protein H7A35_15020 [Planctomycetales bacterium]|nr:hypothetical protein [bacterium]UNM08142.1 MAG: hypothetical protein H7A35_15020 [Planctomycetales bacterium]
MRCLVPWLIILSILLLGSCGGQSGNSELAAVVPAGDGSQSLNAALAELDALPVPAGADAETFAQLKESLRSMLLEAPAERFTSTPPIGEANVIDDLTSGISDNGEQSIQWNYRNVGDYDLNGLVAISDITPIGVHFGKDSSTPDWKAVSRFIDGDRNGEVNISDITPIGVNFNHRVASYLIEGGPGPDGPFTELDEVEFTAGQPMLSGIRMFHYLPAVQHEAYRVVPLDGEGNRGTPSNLAVDFLISDETRIIGQPDGPSFVSRDGDDFVLELPVGMENPIAPGDVVVGAEQGGYLQRVVAVEEQGSQLMLATEPGILTDVFLQGGLGEALDDISQVPVELYTINLSGQVLTEFNGLYAEIQEGSVTFLPNADVAVNYNQYGGVTYLRGLAMGGPLDLGMLVELSAEGWDGPFPPTPEQLDFFEHKMSGFSFDFTAYQNDVPVTMTLVYDLYVGIRGEGQLNGLYSANCFASYDNIRTGGIFNSQGIEDVNEYTLVESFANEPGTTSESGNFSFTAYVRPEIHIKLYGNPIRGNSEDLALTLSPTFTFIGDRTTSPSNGYNYILQTAMDNTYRLELHHIGMDDDPQIRIYDGIPDILLQGFLKDFEPPA